MQLGSKELIRDINSTLVLEAIIEQSPISRADLSKKLGLTKATISSIVQEFINKGLVAEIGSGETSIGRKPTMLSLMQNAGYSISVDLSVDRIDFMATDLLGQCLWRDTIHFSEIGECNVLKEIAAFIDNFLRAAEKNTYGLIGITIAIHGVVKDNAIIFTPYYDLSAYRFVESLTALYHVPVHLYNEANLAVLGENTFSIKTENIASIGVHAGIGLGLVLNGKLYIGNDGYAGEFGHTIIALDGRQCPCGNRGCLEQYGSERALLTGLAQKKQVSRLTFDTFRVLYEAKDPDALETARQFVKFMAAGINNLLNFYNPEYVVLTSEFTNAFPHLLEEIKGQLTSKALSSKNICLSKLNDDAVLYGAATINITDFLNIFHYNPQKL